ncbi:E3 ubiquitin-protein ligase UBR2 isoform X2 [Strongylocentrotus purpuratus]|uniref:E3 ubiquitin-protein ligase n=1 Tax=Strongylocentrotus purpuratus TaxID=7668 RepID=A0A7M7PQT3_STRPU|nr:E3 ubiquitin-protein ligase UBR2 isoform X2 [Strongylocentrotus purpuratus]
MASDVDVMGKDDISNASHLASVWAKCKDSKSLKKAIFSFLADAVPEIFKANEVQPEEEEEFARKVVLILEWYLFGPNPDQVRSELKASECPPQLCGHVFKNGEPTYSCRDCAMDPTCVLCIDCFQKSAHKSHRYKMNTSGGGGYCDCGDEEAWKQEPFCELHSRAATHVQQDPLDNLPQEMKARAVMLFRMLLRHCYRILFLDEPKDIPDDLQGSNSIPDVYCTMLFNDEVHTYEQVISSLKKAVECSRKAALQFATIVDKDGRSAVRRGNERDCERAKNVIERSTSRLNSTPLKVLVMNMVVVAHQTCALKLLNWLSTVAGGSDAMRVLLCQELLSIKEEGQVTAVIEESMLNDTHLWKVARAQWHQLFMSTLLMDSEHKKQFAVLFTKHYPTILVDYSTIDDHDHALSISSLSVQIFTVPTVSRMLVEEHNLLFVILRSFVDQTIQFRDGRGHLQFRRNPPPSIRRALYGLLDLRYVLSNKPESWTGDLRDRVMEGVTVLVELLSSMHCMDSVLRQVGHHIEYEPEWEMAISMQMKLGPCLTLLLEWCASDRSLLIKAYRATMAALRKLSRDQQRENVEIEDKTYSCIKYSVSSMTVSIHYALVRFLAGLHLHLGQYELGFYTEGLMNGPSLLPEELIEDPLRTQVLIAQVHAGMWRRNGYSLLNQIYYYQNVKCQTEMYDKDVIMLQIGGSLMEPNDFMASLVTRFDLVRCWTRDFEESKSPEDCSAHLPIITEEFLGLLIVLFCERYVKGVGNVSDEARVRREVLHQLCISPMAHSELTRALPEDHCHETGMESVIHDIADFKKPAGGVGKGMYELKASCLDEYSPYFYHYSKVDQTKSEEQIRQRRKQEDKPQLILPYAMPALMPSFQPLLRILYSDTFMFIIKTLLVRIRKPKGIHLTDNIVHRTLYLVGVALIEAEASHKEGNPMSFIIKGAQGSPNMFEALQSLVGHQRIESNKDFLEWLIKKYEAMLKLAGHTTSTQMKPPPAPAARSAEELDKEAEEKRNRQEMARKRREHLMKQMSAMQKNFIRENPEFFDATNEGGSPRHRTASTCSMETGDVPAHDYPCCLGPRHSPSVMAESSTATCILCQEEEDITFDGKAMVLAAFIQRSTVLSKARQKTIEDGEKFDPLFASSDLYWGTNVSTCGHIMHSTCWQGFFESLLAKEQRRNLRMRGILNYDISQHQFLCPLCETLSNTVIPLLPSVVGLQNATQEGAPVERKSGETAVNLQEWLEGIQKTLQASAQQKEFEKEQEEAGVVPMEAGANSAAASDEEDIEEKEEGEEEMAGEMELGAMGGEEGGAQGGGGLAEGGDGIGAKEMEEEGKVEGATAMPGAMEGGEIGVGSFIQISTIPSLKRLLAETVSQKFQQLFQFIQVSCLPISENVKEMIRHFSRSAYTVGLGVMPHDDDSRMAILAWNTCAYTVQVTETQLRNEGKALFGALSQRQMDCLRCLIRYSVVNSCLCNYAHVQRHAIRLLSALYPQESSGRPSDPCILDMDVFTLLVSVCMSLPRLYNSNERVAMSLLGGPISDHHLLRVALAAHLVQVLLTASRDIPFEESMEEEGSSVDDSKEGRDLLQACSMLKQYAGLEAAPLPPGWQLVNHVQVSCLPFLRSAALFFHFLTSVPCPAELQNAGIDEFEPLCRYLGLPTNLATLLDCSASPIMEDMIKRWCSHPSIRIKMTEHNPALVRYPIEINQLIDLPRDYSDLMNDRSLFACPRGNSTTQSDSRAPAMCLVCGTVVCSQSYCCQREINGESVGACTAHAIMCGAGSGVFLRVRECNLLLMSGKSQGCSYTPPYLDEYGEPDPGLRRGNPLHLSKECYSELHKLWLSHGIQATVSRKLEGASPLINWQNM